MRDGAHRTARFLSAAAALLGAAAIAGRWLLSDRDVIVLTGAAVVTAFMAKACRSDRRAEERTRIALAEQAVREAALVRTIERLTGGEQTGPIQRLRDVA
jgi:hypothetical protein